MLAVIGTVLAGLTFDWGFRLLKHLIAHLCCCPADYDRFSGQELCDSCSCAIFNGLFEALTAAGVQTTSIDAAINSCADQLWQGLMDSGALPSKTQQHLTTCEPGDCTYSNSTAAVAAADTEYKSSSCPMDAKAFAESSQLKASIAAACGEQRWIAVIMMNRQLQLEQAAHVQAVVGGLPACTSLQR
jgi:hypothetical protein